MDSLGYAYRHLSNCPRAVACYERALKSFRKQGNLYSEARTLDELGDTHEICGDHAVAVAAWSGALRILEGIEHPDADQARLRLNRHSAGEAL